MSDAVSVGLSIGGFVIVCVLAIALVVLARREARSLRDRAETEVSAMRDAAAKANDESTRREAESARREDRLSEREWEIAEDARRGAEFARELERRSEQVFERERDLLSAEREIAVEREHELARISALDIEQARAELVSRLLDEARENAAARIRQIDETGQRDAERRARSIVASAVQRVAVSTSSESVVTLVMLPSEDFKGRIIGREGRNIRTFEALTGVNLIVDDSPDSVLLSCFDPARREVAKLTLESLLADGRIHPQRIEAAYERALTDVKGLAMDVGYAAAERAHVSGLSMGLVAVLGELRLRTSFGQNVLDHLVETAQIAALLAAELGLDVELARRAAFLHDIGKALTHEIDGSHAIVGAELAERHGESPAVVNAIAAHHDEVEARSVEAVVIQAADACSASRPGARREELDHYVERMRRLETIARANPGVRQVYAMSAGREIRIAVEPSMVADVDAQRLAREVAATIHRDMTYPGQITVVVVREFRASATAT